MEVLQTLLPGLILLIQAVFDIRYRKLPLWITLIGTVIGAVLMITMKELSLERGLSFLPGIVCLLYGKISKQAIGYGDGLLILMLGVYWDVHRILEVCIWAFFLGALIALAIFVIKRKGKQEIPFVPFLLIGLICERIQI